MIADSQIPPERLSREDILPWRWNVYLIRYAAQPCRTIHCHISGFKTVIFEIFHCLVSCNILLQSIRQAFRPDKLCTCNSSRSALQELLTRSETSHCKNAVAGYCRIFHRRHSQAFQQKFYLSPFPDCEVELDQVAHKFQIREEWTLITTPGAGLLPQRPYSYIKDKKMSNIHSRQDFNDGPVDDDGFIVDDGDSFWYTRVRCSSEPRLPVTDICVDRPYRQMVDLLRLILPLPSVPHPRILARKKED
jgi:hypothetical protein